MKICYCYPADCWAEDGVTRAFTNNGSWTLNNVGSMQPGTVGGLNNPYPIPGTVLHNINLETVKWGLTDARERRALLRDYDNYDFRPRAIGPELVR